MTDLPVEVELRRVRLPLVTPHVTWTTSLDEREVILVRVVLGNGSEGWGECPTLPLPTYTSEYTDGAWALLRDVLAPWHLGLGNAIDGSVAPWSRVQGHGMAQGAVLDARIDAKRRWEGRSISHALGARNGVPADHAITVPTATVLSGWADIDDLLARAQAAVDRGTSLLKLKLGRDLDPVWALRSTLPDALLAADLNGGYRPGDDDDDGLLAEIDELGLAYLEQPYPATEGLLPVVELRVRTDTPIALDESITDWASAEAALHLGAASIINVKPARLGGTNGAASVVQACIDEGAGAFVGGMLETGIGRAHALAVAALSGCTLPTDLGPSSRYFAQDLTEPFELNADGSLTVPTGPGLGVVPDPDRLEAATVDRLVVRR